MFIPNSPDRISNDIHEYAFTWIGLWSKCLMPVVVLNKPWGLLPWQEACSGSRFPPLYNKGRHTESTHSGPPKCSCIYSTRKRCTLHRHSTTHYGRLFCVRIHWVVRIWIDTTLFPISTTQCQLGTQHRFWKLTRPRMSFVTWALCL